ncbi:CHAD domain-containing protein [Algoriphagus sp. SE2]
MKIPRAEFSKSTFHKLRVEIKKLNAIFNLINFCSKDFKRKETFHPFKEVFKKAGKVRELQLERAILDKYLSNNSFLDYRRIINNKLLKAQDSFFELLGKELDKRIAGKIEVLIPFIDQVNKKKAAAFIEKKKDEIEILLNKNPLTTDELHKLRKLLKTLKYSIGCISSDTRTANESEILKFTDSLGKWHDYHQALIQFEKSYDLEEIEPVEAAEISAVKLNISNKRDLLLQQILKDKSEFKFPQESDSGNI